MFVFYRKELAFFAPNYPNEVMRMYEGGGESYCGSWTIRWNLPMEAFTRDGESAGFGRFVGLVDGVAAVQLWIIPVGIKVEHAPGYAVQIDVKEKVIMVIKKPPAY